VGLAAAVISFVLYAATLFALPQMRDVSLCRELSSLTAAVSNIAYKARLGAVYSEVLQGFCLITREIGRRYSKRSRASVEPGALLKTTADGNGVGKVVFATETR
jgi:hypothetical protein